MELENVFLASLMAVVFAVAGYALYTDHFRRRGLVQWAHRRGWRLDIDVEHKMPPRRGLAVVLSDKVFADYVISGHDEGYPVILMEYSVQPREQRDWATGVIGSVILTVGRPVGDLTITPESAGDKVLTALTGTDIDFESPEFNARFRVRSPHRKWAFDVIGPRTMGHLLDCPDFHVALQAEQILVWRPGSFRVRDYVQALALAHAIRAGLPRWETPSRDSVQDC